MDLQVDPLFCSTLSSPLLLCPSSLHTAPLQYLDEDKKVEEDLDIRTMLLEALTQLCATR